LFVSKHPKELIKMVENQEKKLYEPGVNIPENVIFSCFGYTYILFFQSKLINFKLDFELLTIRY
ncbi:MAG: hypothetical protein ACTSYI_10335, partial [Promethearchaeota archaeon]